MSDDNGPGELDKGPQPLLVATLTVEYFISTDGDPIVKTNIEGSSSDEMPNYFEVVAMHAMSMNSIDKIFGID